MINFAKNTYKSLREQLLSVGINEEADYLEVSQIQSANRGAIICFVMSFIATLATYNFVPKPFIYVPLVVSFLYLSTFLLNFISFYTLASINCWLISLLLFFWLSGAYGRESNAYLLFIIAEMVAIFNLDIRNRKLIITILSLPIILVSIAYLTDFSLFLIPSFSPEQRIALNPIIFFTVIISSGVVVLIYAQRTQENLEQLQGSKNILQEKLHELEETNDDLQKANEELDRFVYSVSHDLRAPITSVMGLLDLCTSDKENRDIYLALQRKSVNKLDGFIKDILHYARNSRLPLETVPINFPVFVKEIFESQSFAEEAYKMEMDIKIKGDALIFSDEFRLNVIISNIISNSIRYRKKNTSNSFIRFDISLSQKEAKIEISDNGIGIEANHLPHIFEMFYRANAKSQGSGLGLYIVREAIHKLKGRIEAESALGMGTIFTLYIPNLKAEENLKFTLPNAQEKVNL